MLLTLRREGGCIPETRARGMVYVPTPSLGLLKKLEHPARFCCLNACHPQENCLGVLVTSSVKETRSPFFQETLAVQPTFSIVYASRIWEAEFSNPYFFLNFKNNRGAQLTHSRSGHWDRRLTPTCTAMMGT